MPRGGVGLLGVLMLLGGALAEPSQAARGSVVHVDADGRRGSAFAVHQIPHGDAQIVLFLTSARLLDPHGGLRARVVIDGTATIELTHADIFVPFDNYRDVALLRAVVPGVPLRALPLVFDHVGAGALFVISGSGADGRMASSTQQVRFAATRAVIGDRPATGISDCVGAPALIGGGAFGVVAECAPERVVIVTPIAAARHFIERIIASAGTQPGEQP